jgi:hypothetical protein
MFGKHQSISYKNSLAPLKLYLFAVLYNRAFCYHKLGDLKNTYMNLDEAGKVACTPDQKESLANCYKDFDRPFEFGPFFIDNDAIFTKQPLFEFDQEPMCSKKELPPRNASLFTKTSIKPRKQSLEKNKKVAEEAFDSGYESPLDESDTSSVHSATLALNTMSLLDNYSHLSKSNRDTIDSTLNYYE